jgi:hypothetical protein
MIHRTRAGAEYTTFSKRLVSPLLVLPVLALALNACAGGLLWGVGEEGPAVSYQLYLSQETSGTVEFEQYRSVPSGVFIECGSNVRGKPQPKEQGIARISADRSELIAEKAREVIEESEGGAAFTFGPASGPNQALVSLKTDARVIEIRTSLDSLAQSEADNVVALKEFLEAVRGVLSRPLCGHKAFAQISRQGL